MAMKEIITVKAPQVQVGDIICGLGTPDHNRTDGKNPAGLEVDWIPAHKVLEAEQTHQAPTPPWWQYLYNKNSTRNRDSHGGVP